MKFHALIVTVVTMALSCASCAAQAPPDEDSEPFVGPPARTLELPGSPGTGQPREVRLLLDEPALKLATIVLRAGTVLPEHHAATPVTILALQGGGTAVVGTERLRLDAAHAVLLAPGVPHAIEPDPGTDLVLLVHHLGCPAEGGPLGHR